MRQRVFPYAHYNELSRSHDLILFFIPPLLESRLLLSLCVFPRVFFFFCIVVPGNYSFLPLSLFLSSYLVCFFVLSYFTLSIDCCLLWYTFLA
jgi:hypothetical protein